ncbi:hypothetical protein C8Q80DRAFT_358760 [Daedaleopsis nitida]|nr:hypothetical protein C8Q80DRAFT_358760 [Daedaleopsis nitida]
MALGGSPATTSPSSSSTGDPNPNPPTTSNPSSSLPFSFLVTFVAIFLFFLGCGLGSRRVTRTLRRNLGLEVTGLGSPRAATIARERPLIWDVFPCDSLSVLSDSSSKDAKGPSGGTGAAAVHIWSTLIPLCATYVRPSHAAPPSTSPSPSSPYPNAPQSPLAQSTLYPLPLARDPAPPPPPTMLRWAAGGMGGMGFALARAGMRSTVPRASLPPPRPTPSTPSNTSNIPRAAPEVRWRGHRLPGFLARALLPVSVVARSLPSSAPDGDASAGEELEMVGREGAPVQALQVLVLVTMPSAERALARRARTKAADGAGESPKSLALEAQQGMGEAGLGEYALGVARVPWDAAGLCA